MQLRKLTVSTFLAVALVLLFAETGGQAAGEQVHSLPYSKGFLVTGDYVIGGVDLNEDIHPIVDGFSEATINMPASPCPAGQKCDAVPANAEVIAAYLFWETITIEDDPATLNVDESIAPAAGVQFRGEDIDITDVLTVKRSSSVQGASTPCWSSGEPLQRHIFRADVLRFLPMLVDKDNNPTGRLLVNDADLLANGFPLHKVKLPVRIGNEDPESAGASLLVVYRDPSEPLRKIVIYDGIYTQPDINTPMEQTLQGFYLSSTTESAKFTHISASGQPNQNDKIAFQTGSGGGVLQQVWADPFAAGSASQRAWANPTYDVSSLMQPGTNSGVYGETVKTRVYHQPTNGGDDCLTWGAVVFSTAVADLDGDGLPDGLEGPSPQLGGIEMKDPDGKDLPNLNAMGADDDVKDIFIEVNAMKADPGTSYGSVAGCNEDPELAVPSLCAPYDSTQPTLTDSVGHHHMLTPADLKKVGDAYSLKGIRPHFDVGNIASYKARPPVIHSEWVDTYNSNVADQYLVGFGVAEPLATKLMRGGEIITETACDPNTLFCHYPAFPGTVIFKFGLQEHRDSMVRDDGTELTLQQLTDPNAPGYFNWNAGTKRRRFDQARKGLFRYLLLAHSGFMPKSFPCLDDGEEAAYYVHPETGVESCTDPLNPDLEPNPDFNALEYHVPASTSGIADLPGGDVLVTLGFWDELVGKPFARSGTIFHELGHNLELWHGGLPPIWGNKTLNTANYFEPNCKPNHQSSMSYMFQVHGLFDNADAIHLDYSGTAHAGINETTAGGLADLNALFPAPAYQPAWFAPALSALAADLEVSAAVRFCSGQKFDPAAPPAEMARVHADSVTDDIDWNGDKLSNTGAVNQDVNFDGTATGPSKLLNGSNEWDSIRLDQIGGAPQGLLLGSLENVENPELTLLSHGSLFSKSGSLFSKSGSLFSKSGSLFSKSGSIWSKSGSLFSKSGSLFSKSGSLFSKSGRQDVTYKQANDVGKERPYGLALCVIGTPGCSTANEFTDGYHRIEGTFNAPPFGTFTGFEVQRKRASEPDSGFDEVTGVTVTLDSTTGKLRFIDYTELADGTNCRTTTNIPAQCDYTYRVRGHADDGDTGWSKSVTATAIDDAPVAAPDGPGGVYQTDNKSVLNVPAPGVLGNDSDHDSPTAYRGRNAVLVTGPAAGTGTLSCVAPGQPVGPGICTNGSFRYTPPKGGSFVGLVTFTYKADDGLSNDGHSPQVPLSAATQATVTINVFKR